MSVCFKYNGLQYTNPATMPVDVRQAFDNLVEYLNAEQAAPSSPPAPPRTKTSERPTVPSPRFSGTTRSFSDTRPGVYSPFRGSRLRGSQRSAEAEIAELYNFLNQPPARNGQLIIIDAPPRPFTGEIETQPEASLEFDEHPATRTWNHLKQTSKLGYRLFLTLSLIGAGYAAWWILSAIH